MSEDGKWHQNTSISAQPQKSKIMFLIPFSFLPSFVVMMLALGQAANSQDEWATQYIEKYKITPEQVAQLRVIEERYCNQTANFRLELKQAERELFELMVSTASSTQWQEKARQFEALQTEAAQLYFNEFLEIREVLTLEQRRQWSVLDKSDRE